MARMNVVSPNLACSDLKCCLPCTTYSKRWTHDVTILKLIKYVWDKTEIKK